MVEENYNNDQYQNYQSQGQEVSDSFLKAMIEVEETIQKFEMEALRKKRLKVDLKTKTKRWIPMAEGIEPVCNELGISEILGNMRGRATIIGRLTKKTDDEIMKDMFQFHRSMIELFALRADDWELDEDVAKPLLEAVVALVQDIVFSSRGGFASINIKSQYQRTEHTNTNVAPETTRSIMGLKI